MSGTTTRLPFQPTMTTAKFAAVSELASHSGHPRKLYATRLPRDVGGDFLEGRGGLLEEAGILVRTHVAEKPQRVWIWLPTVAQDGPGAQEVERSRRQFRPSLRCPSRCYRRGRPLRVGSEVKCFDVADVSSQPRCRPGPAVT